MDDKLERGIRHHSQRRAGQKTGYVYPERQRRAGPLQTEQAGNHAFFRRTGREGRNRRPKPAV